MAGRQTRQPGLGAPGTTGAEKARDPLGAPGSTGASRTNMGAPGYDPKDYNAGTGEQHQMHRPGAGQEYTYVGSGEQQQMHRPSAGQEYIYVGSGEQQQMHHPSAGQEYTYGTAGSMGPTAAGYHAGVHVPANTPGVTTTTYGTSGGGLFDHSAGVGGGGGYDTGKMGERVHGVAGERTERGERFEVADADIGSGYDFGEMASDRTHGIGGGDRAGNHGGYDTGGGRLNEREGQGHQRRG